MSTNPTTDRPSFADVDAALLRQIVEDCDGWTIFSPDELVTAGLDAELVKAVTTIERSDGTPKGTIFGPTGEIIPELRGVYGPILLKRVCADLGISSDSAKFGRGSMVRELQARIYAELDRRAAAQPAAE